MAQHSTNAIVEPSQPTPAHLNENPLPLISPITGVIFWGSSSGKTYITAKILLNAKWCFDKPVNSIHYFTVHPQQIYRDLEMQLDNITFHYSMPTKADIEALSNPELHDVIVLDDWGCESASSDVIENLYTRQAHHYNVSIFNLKQNFYSTGKNRRTQNLNTSVIILLRNPMGADQVAILARQRFPGHAKAFLDTYNKEVCSQRFGYIVIDSHPASDPLYSVRGGIFPGDEKIIYTFP
jgi:hypothetical protein